MDERNLVYMSITYYPDRIPLERLGAPNIKRSNHKHFQRYCNRLYRHFKLKGEDCTIRNIYGKAYVYLLGKNENKYELEIVTTPYIVNMIYSQLMCIDAALSNIYGKDLYLFLIKLKEDLEENVFK